MQPARPAGLGRTGCGLAAPRYRSSRLPSGLAWPSTARRPRWRTSRASPRLPATPGTTVTLDMEDHARVDATLRLVAELRADFPDLGCVIQSYLRRSADDCRTLAVAGSRVRLCKGAYQAPEGVGLARPRRSGPELCPVHADPARRARLPDAGHSRPAPDQDRRRSRRARRAATRAASSTRCCMASGRPSRRGWRRRAPRCASTSLRQ